MFGSNFRGASAYAQVGVETQVAVASPHKLITMLFEGAMTAISNAMRQMSENDIQAKGKSISHAILIIESGLRGALDYTAGGEIAANLDALYEYMGRRLLQANLENSQTKLAEVHRLLGELKTAWDGINPSLSPSSPTESSEPHTSNANSAALARRFVEVAA